MSFTYASVADIHQLNSRLRRLVLQVDEPGTLGVKVAGDSAVGIYFPDPTTATIDPDATEGRNYTVRHQDGSRFTIDVVLHAHGPGTTWASTAAVGDRVGLDHARSWYHPEPHTDWQLLVSDLSGLPAAARIIDELPPGTRAILILEAIDGQDLQYLPSRPDVPIFSRLGRGNGRTPSALADAVRDVMLPTGRGYCWFAGEAAESRTVRKYLRSRGWTIDQYDITGYWRQDSEAWDARFAEVEDDVLAVYEKALNDGKGDKVAFEEFDDACERIGL